MNYKIMFVFMINKIIKLLLVKAILLPYCLCPPKKKELIPYEWIGKYAASSARRNG